MVDFYDRGHGVEVEPFLRTWKPRGRDEAKGERFRRVGLTLWRFVSRFTERR